MFCGSSDQLVISVTVCIAKVTDLHSKFLMLYSVPSLFECWIGQYNSDFSCTPLSESHSYIILTSSTANVWLCPLSVPENPHWASSAISHWVKCFSEVKTQTLLKRVNMTWSWAWDFFYLCLFQVYVRPIHIGILSCFFNLWFLSRIMTLLPCSINDTDL